MADSLTAKYEGNLTTCVWCDGPLPACPPDCSLCAQNICQRVCYQCQAKHRTAMEESAAAPLSESDTPF